MSHPLPSWKDTPTRRAITAFVDGVTGAGGPGSVPPEDRVAVFDNDGTLWCEKPVHIWSRVGRRPIPALRLLLLHDDGDREFAYTAGAETALDAAGAEGWTVVSMAGDWTAVFSGDHRG